MLTLRASGDGKVTLESPDDLAFRPAHYRAIIVKMTPPEIVAAVGVEGQTAEGKWITLVPTTDLNNLSRARAGLMLPLTGTFGDMEFRRVRLCWKTDKSRPLVLERIAFYVIK